MEAKNEVKVPNSCFFVRSFAPHLFPPISYNVSEVAEPALILLLTYCCSRNQATEFCSSPCSWPVGTEAAAGGRSQQLSCYVLSRPTRPTTAVPCSTSSIRQFRASQPQGSAGVTTVSPGSVTLHPADLAGTNALVLGLIPCGHEPGSRTPKARES